MASIKGSIKLTLFLLWTILLVPFQLIVLLFSKGPASYIVPTLWHKVVCGIMGVKVKTSGTPMRDKQTIYVSNHISYLDIPAISTVLKTSFVAKEDVAGWPVFGFLSKLQQTAFISRSRESARKEKNALENMLATGKSLVIFPEGTSTNGSSVLPFKSSLFSIALTGNQPDLYIQPFTIEIKEVDGHSLSSDADRDIYAWHGDMTLAPHLWAFACTKGAVIELDFHDPLKASDYNDRKLLAKKCYESVSKSLQTERMAAE